MLKFKALDLSEPKVAQKTTVVKATTTCISQVVSSGSAAQAQREPLMTLSKRDLKWFSSEAFVKALERELKAARYKAGAESLRQLIGKRVGEQKRSQAEYLAWGIFVQDFCPAYVSRGFKYHEAKGLFASAISMAVKEAQASQGINKGACWAFVKLMKDKESFRYFWKEAQKHERCVLREHIVL